MAEGNYARTISTAASPPSVYRAITADVGAWWTTPQGGLDRVGDRAKFMFPPGRSYWTFELVSAEESLSAEWRCVEALHLHDGFSKEIEQEWLGTSVTWLIEKPPAGKTIIHFSHDGLTPELNCFEVCEAGWDYFLLTSLQAYLDTGVGLPHVPPS